MKKLLPLLILIIIWLVIGSLQLVKPIFLPPLSSVLLSLKEILFSVEGLLNIVFTLKRIAIAFVIGTLISIPLGILLGSFKSVWELFEGYVDFIRSVPVTAMFPLFLIFFGFGDSSKIAMGAWASGFVILVNTIHGVLNTKKNRKLMALTKRATSFQVLTKITLFETLPFIFAGLRIGVSWNLIVIIVAEMFIGTSKGLGHIIYDASVMFDTPMVIAGIIIIGVIGYSINLVVVKVEKRVVHWKGI